MARTGRPAVVPTPRRVRWRRRRLKQARTPAGLGFVRAGRHRSPMPAGLGFVRMPAPLRFVRMARSSGSFGISRTTALHGAACCDGGSRHRSRPTQGSRASRVRSDASATRVRSVFITCSTSRLRCRCDHPAGTPAPRATGHPAGHGPRNAGTPADLGFVWHFCRCGLVRSRRARKIGSWFALARLPFRSHGPTARSLIDGWFGVGAVIA